MTDNTLRSHPLVIVAATAIILTCLLAVGVMTGIVPSPLAKTSAPATSAPAETLTKAPAAGTSAAKTHAASAREKRAEPAAGSTSGSGASQSGTGGGPARTAAVCNECGTVTGVRTIKQQGEAGLIGPAAGGVVGGVIGHQIGHGTTNTVATIAGAAIGAAGGTEIERRYKSTTQYVVDVRLDDGTTRSFTYANPPGVEAGSKVKIVDGQLVHA
jgi:outer membrane lipoprotein SlyB